MRPALLGLAVAAGAVSCGGGGTQTASSPTPHAGSATDWLLRLDELTLPGFRVATGTGTIDPASLGAGDATVASAVRAAAVRSAAQAHFFREVPELATAGGPIDVTTTVVVCGSAGGATTLRDALARHLDGVPGATGVSTGPLADGGHADLSQATVQGVTVAQTTLVWRAGDLVSVLVVGERDTGSPVQDALVVAAPQVRRQTR
ncbi:MAG TPA: hypothetical protein VFO60_10930 [Candidatus Dormibacteraeota bacterium]|nr:hypothetical protein [Candidatus Dormibacteraeota bacterium]